MPGEAWLGHVAIEANEPLLIESGRLTVAALLKEAGYATACIGKWHLGFGRAGMEGWDDALGPDWNRDLTPGPLNPSRIRSPWKSSFIPVAISRVPNRNVMGTAGQNIQPSDGLPDKVGHSADGGNGTRQFGASGGDRHEDCVGPGSPIPFPPVTHP